MKAIEEKGGSDQGTEALCIEGKQKARESMLRLCTRDVTG